VVSFDVPGIASTSVPEVDEHAPTARDDRRRTANLERRMAPVRRTGQTGNVIPPRRTVAMYERKIANKG
jgi:hypothetical protein